MKKMYAMRWTDGRLMEWNGAVWNLKGTYTPTNWPTPTIGGTVTSTGVTTQNNVARHRQNALFVYRGKLHSRWRAYNTITGIKQARIDVFNGTDMANITSAAIDDNMEYWGNTINYKDRIIWLATKHYYNTSLTDERGYLYLYVFWYDGTNTPQFVRRRADEMGFFEVGTTGVAGTGSNRYDRNQSYHYTSNYALGPRLIDLNDRLFYYSPGSYGTSQSFVFWGRQGIVDFDPATTTMSSELPKANMQLTSSRTTETSGYQFGQETIGSVNQVKWTSMNKCIHAACPFNGKLYTLMKTGIVYQWDVSSNTKTQVLDLTTFTDMGIPGEPIFTTTTNGTGSTQGSAQLAMSNNNYPAYWLYSGPWALGGSVIISNYQTVANGGSGTTTVANKIARITGYQYTGGSNLYINLLFDDDTVPVSQPTGTNFKIRTAFGGMQSGYAGFIPPNWGHAFTYNNKIYFVNITSSGFENNASSWTNPWPWMIIEWDGVGTPVWHKFSSPDGFYRISGVTYELDEKGGTLEILTADHQYAQSVNHWTVDLTTWTRTDHGSVYQRPNALTNVTINSTTYNDFDQYMGISNNNLVCFDVGDVTGSIVSQVVDTVNKKITITYSLSGVNSDTASVFMDYNTGIGLATGWAACTRKGSEGEDIVNLTSSPTGINHTFVHDIGTDLGTSFAGTLQYRVRINTQTRN